jgi:RNA polymerase sigma factor (sigma-70 family)
LDTRLDRKLEQTLGDADLLLLSVRHPEAFVTFYERHAEAILRFFARRTVQADVAADLTAETFAQAYASRSRYRPAGVEAGAWLYAIARHQLSRFYRSGRVEAVARQRLGMPQRELDSADHERIELMAGFADLRRTVGDALDQLPASERQAVSLRCVDEMPYEAVANALHCSEQAARARVSRGLRRLHALLDPQREALAQEGWTG